MTPHFTPRPSGFWTRNLWVLLLLALVPGAVWAAAPVIDSLTASSTTVLPGSTVTLTVNAHDPDCATTCTTGCGLYILSDLTAWTANGGTFPTRNNGTAGSPYAATAVWQAPTVEGTYTLTVSVSDSGTWMCGGRGTATQSLSIQVSAVINAAPVIDDLTVTPANLFLGEVATLNAVAHDPDGDPLTYVWSVDRGTVIAGAPGFAEFQASTDTPGIAMITLTVTDDKGAPATRTVSVSVTSARADRAFSEGLFSPQRVAADAAGTLFVVDRSAGGILAMNGATGAVLKLIPIANATAVAVDATDRLLIGTSGGALLADRSGLPEKYLQGPAGSVAVQDVAVDTATGRLSVLYRGTQRVAIFDAAGEPVSNFGAIGPNAGQFQGALALAVAPTGEILVGDSGKGQVHVFGPDGTYLRVFGGRGNHAGEFLQLQGLAVDPAGRIYVSDAFHSRVTVFNADGTLREILGQYGPGLGQLMTPSGLAFLGSFGRFVVASTNSASLQMFALRGATEPVPNRAPTVPQPLEPSAGAVMPHGTPVLLMALNAVDPDFQPVTYTFELYDASVVPPLLLATYTAQAGAGTTQVDASLDAAGAGLYSWRVKAGDGELESPWSEIRTFEIGKGKPNQPPSAPLPQDPSADAQAADLEPFLLALNATDPEGTALNYRFEVALQQGTGLVSVAQSSPITEGASVTPWQVPAGVLGGSQQVFWRALSNDGWLNSPWSSYASFWTPPLQVPDEGEYGDLPEGDRSRPAEVRYELDPTAGNTTLYFQVYDLSAGELTLQVNGGLFSWPVPSQVANDWSFTVSLTIPGEALNPSGPNLLRFVHSGAGDPWGIRRLSLVAPPVPSLAARAYNTVVDLAWAQRPGLPQGTLLRLHRAFSAVGPFAPIGDFDPTESSLRDTGLPNGTTYYYRAVYIFSDGKESEPSPVVSATPRGGPLTPITDLKVTRQGDDLVLTWTPVTSSPGIEKVELYRDATGQWNPDTGGFTNQIGIQNPFQGQYVIPGGALTAPNQWYSAVPLGYDGSRATP